MFRKRGTFGAFTVRPFRLQWTSSSLLTLGFWMTTIALQWQVVQTSGGDPLQLGAIYCLALVPILFLSPVAGSLLDRTDRLRVLTYCAAGLAAVAMSGGLILVGIPDLPFAGLAPIALALGTFNTFQAIASQSLVPNWLPREHLSSGVSLTSLSANIARLIGPAIAAPLLLVGSPGWCLVGYSVAALLATLVLLRLRRSHPVGRTARAATAVRSRDPLGGWRHAATRPPALAAIVLTGIAATLGSSYISALPAITASQLGMGPETLSALVAVSGVGAIMGSLTTAGLTPRQRITLSAGLTLLLGIALVGVGLSTSVYLTAGLLVLAGALNISTMNTLSVAIQNAVLDDYRGRVTALFLIAWGGLLPIGSLALGALGTAIGIGAAVAVFAGVLSAAAAVALVKEIVGRRAGPAHDLE